MKIIIPIILSFAVMSCEGPLAPDEVKSLRAATEVEEHSSNIKVEPITRSIITSDKIVDAISEKDLLALEDKWEKFVSPAYEKHCLACHQDTYGSGKKWLDHLAMFCMPGAETSNCLSTRISEEMVTSPISMPPGETRKEAFSVSAREAMQTWISEAISTLEVAKKQVEQSETRGNISADTPTLSFPPDQVGGPTLHIMNAEALTLTYRTVFNDENIGIPKSAAHGGFSTKFGIKWINNITPDYIKGLRIAVDNKCTNIATSEVNSQLLGRAHNGFLVKGNGLPTAEHISEIMTQFFRSPPLSGLHAGASEMAEAIQAATDEFGTINKGYLNYVYMNLCVAIATDIRVYSR